MDVFLSYSSTNHIYAQQMRDRLTEAGLVVWQDQGQLRAGEDWREAIDQGLTNCRCVVVILTPSASASSYVTYEWAFAYGQGKTIIPAVFEACEKHPRMAVWQYEDFTHPQHQPWDNVIARVCEVSGPSENTSAVTMAAEPSPDPDQAAATSRIMDYLDNNGLNMVSFERIQERIDQSYTDAFLTSLTVGADRRFKNRILAGDRRGLGRLKPIDRN